MSCSRQKGVGESLQNVVRTSKEVVPLTRSTASFLCAFNFCMLTLARQENQPHNKGAALDSINTFP